MADLSVFILAFNERLHIERCINAAKQVASAVFVVDSGSTDGTVELARSLGATVIDHVWENNHGRQTNWAIENLPMTTDWVMRVDADEIITPELANELERKLPAISAEVTGLVVKRRQVFLGHTLRWGGTYPIRLLRIFRRGIGRCEERWMDEHLFVTSGRIETLECELEDRNLNELKWWTSKQANYAIREAASVLIAQGRDRSASPLTSDNPQNLKRPWRRLYRRLPPFTGAFVYFAYRYIVRLGFLDGAPGLVWHVLQGFWYRFLVDAILYEVRGHARCVGRPPLEVLAETHQLKL